MDKIERNTASGLHTPEKQRLGRIIEKVLGGFHSRVLGILALSVPTFAAALGVSVGGEQMAKRFAEGKALSLYILTSTIFGEVNSKERDERNWMNS